MVLLEQGNMKKSDTFSFGPWKITTTKGAILKAEDAERY